jgi:chromosomal replication initiation ATPase DnaA
LNPRGEILMKKADKVDPPHDAAFFIASNVPPNVRELKVR